MHSGAEKELINIQKQIDDEYDVYSREEFKLRVEHHKNLEPILKRRDEVLSKVEDFWQLTIAHADLIVDMLPVVDEHVQTNFITKLEAWYEENCICVKLKIAPNSFLKTKELIKKMNVFEKTVEEGEIEYKQNVTSKLLSFFENGKFDRDMFEVFYELYVNAIFYYSLQYD